MTTKKNGKLDKLVDSYLSAKNLADTYQKQAEELRDKIIAYLKEKGQQEVGKFVAQTSKWLVEASEVSRTERNFDVAMKYVEDNKLKEVLDINWKEWDLLVKKGRIPKEVDAKVSKRVVAYYRLYIK